MSPTASRYIIGNFDMIRKADFDNETGIIDSARSAALCPVRWAFNLNVYGILEVTGAYIILVEAQTELVLPTFAWECQHGLLID